MEIYKILQDIMQKKGFTIPDVARACNLSDSTVRGIIVRKQKSVALEVAFKLSSGLDVSLECLNGDVRPKPVKNKVVGFSEREFSIVEKYRLLDERGKAAVENTIDMELSYSSNKRLSDISKDAAKTVQSIGDDVNSLKQTAQKLKK